MTDADHKELARRLAQMPCPTCAAKLDSNGLIVWCERGHVFSVARLKQRRFEEKR